MTSLLNRKLSSKPHREYHVEGKRPSGEEQQRKWYSQECYVPCQKEKSKAIMHQSLTLMSKTLPKKICKKICQKEVISSVNDFFSPSKIFLSATKLQKRSFGGLQVLSGNKILCSLTVILCQVILFHKHDQLKFH